MTESPDPTHVPLDPAWGDETVAVQAGRPARVPGAPMNEPVTLMRIVPQGRSRLMGSDSTETT